MILHCKFTVDDYVAAYRTFAQKGARIWMSRVCLLAGAGSFLFGIWLMSLPKGSFSLALPMFLISVMWLFFGRPWWRSAGRRAFSNRPELQQEYAVRVDDQGIRFEGAISSFGWTWPAFTGSAESEKVFLVFVSRSAFAILPKRIFGPGEADQFREILRQKLPRK